MSKFFEQPIDNDSSTSGEKEQNQELDHEKQRVIDFISNNGEVIDKFLKKADIEAFKKFYIDFFAALGQDRSNTFNSGETEDGDTTQIDQIEVLDKAAQDLMEYLYYNDIKDHYLTEEQGVRIRKLNIMINGGIRRVISSGPTVQKILEQMRDKLDAGAYQLIIGGADTSGRIPTLLFDHIIKNIYDHDKRPRPSTKFFAGGPWIDCDDRKRSEKAKQEAAEYIRKWVASISTDQPIRVLITTEFTAAGTSLYDLCEILKENNIRFDIMTLAGDDPEIIYRDIIDIEKGDRGYSGRVEDIFGGLLGLAGVSKERYKSEIFSKPERSVNPDLDFRSTAVMGRHVASLLADQLSQEYLAARDQGNKLEK